MYQNGRPEYLKEAARASARRLGVESIGLYQFHPPDPNVPHADSIGAIRDLLDDGVIQMAGISNANVAQIDEATRCSTAGSSRCRTSSLRHSARASPSWTTAPRSASPSSRGRRSAASVEPATWAGSTPRSRRSPSGRGVSPQQVALAWELALAQVVIPIPGASRPQSIEDSVRAAELSLTADELAVLAELSQAA